METYAPLTNIILLSTNDFSSPFSLTHICQECIYLHQIEDILE